ncbi:MAG TPA: sigma-70 family RNA polymerase sigma factor [Blastocatellia bacterium]|nr:sigma-70 family RNA polymerase sigma factor [Blastocatellia bacterium]
MRITQLLIKWSEGDETALHQLTPLVYDELRRLARSYLRRHAFQNSLQPTAVVHEAWLKLVDQRQITWQNRAQFFGLAAKVMRDLLVDHARARQAAKRGGGRERLTLSAAADYGGQSGERIDLLALDEALKRLAEINPRRSQVVELRFFGGLTGAETAAALGVSDGTVERDWNLARAWLYNELSKK